MSLRIATYNIHRCVGRDGMESPARIAAVLREIDADVVALQEIAHQKGKPGNVLDFLAESIDAAAIEGPTLHASGSLYGNALLTRVAAASVRRVDLSVPRRERRGALDVVLTVNELSVRVLTTHLGLRPLERRRQVKHILSILNADAVDVTVLLGDLNEWFSKGRPIRWLARAFDPLPSPATFPSHRPLVALDRLYVRPRNRLVSLAAHRSRLARKASDHLPLVADLDL